MRVLMLAVALIGCGGGGTGTGGSVSSPPLSGPFVPGTCVQRCDALKPVLIRDFGVSNPMCGTGEQWGATSDAECDCIFARQFGVLVNGRSCPAR